MWPQWLDPSDDFTIGVASSLVASAVTYLATVVYRLRLPHLSTLVLWRRMRTNMVIVPSAIEASLDPQPTAGRRYSLIPLAEARALVETLENVSLRVRANPPMSSVETEDDFRALKGKNLIVVGGPRFNAACRFLLVRLGPRLRFQFRRLIDTSIPQDDPSLKRFVDRSREPISLELPQAGDREYGMLVFVRNPFQPDSLVVCAAGLNQLSTLAAVRYAFKIRGWRLLRAFIRGDGVQFMLSCDVQDGQTLSNIHIIAETIIPVES